MKTITAIPAVAALCASILSVDALTNPPLSRIRFSAVRLSTDVRGTHSTASRAKTTPTMPLTVSVGGGGDDLRRSGPGTRNAGRYLFGKGLSSQAVSLTIVGKVLLKIKRAATILFTASVLFLAGAKISSTPSHASSSSPLAVTADRVVHRSSSNPLTTRLVSSASTKLDRMVDRYVRERMFDDDRFDPFESAYREAHADTSGLSPYPQILSETATSILGKQEVQSDAEEGGSGRANLFVTTVAQFSSLLQGKFGMAKGTANLVVAGGGIALLPAVCLGGMAFSNSQRRMINREQVKRYGAVQELDASEKKEEDIEAPDDDEEDDDDDDDEEEDDEEDD